LVFIERGKVKRIDSDFRIHQTSIIFKQLAVFIVLRVWQRIIVMDALAFIPSRFAAECYALAAVVSFVNTFSDRATDDSVVRIVEGGNGGAEE
jgi:hypothetical protein